MFYSISWYHHLVPFAKCMGKNFLHNFSICSVFDCLVRSFAALQLYGMVWYLPMQLQITVAPSCLKLRNKFWIQFVGRSPDELSQWHAPGLSLASVCVAKPNHRHGPMPWLSSSSIKIVKLQLPDWWQLSTKSAHVCSLAKSMRSSENTECSRAPWTAATSPRPAGAVLRSACPRWTEMD